MSDTELELKIAKLKLSQYKSIIEIYMDILDIVKNNDDYKNSINYKHLLKVLDYALFDSGLRSMK